MLQSSPSIATPLYPPPPLSVPSLFSLYLSFPDHDRSCWWSVRLASTRRRDDFKTDKERAALSPFVSSGADDPGSKRGNCVGRKKHYKSLYTDGLWEPGGGGGGGPRIVIMWCMRPLQYDMVYLQLVYATPMACYFSSNFLFNLSHHWFSNYGTCPTGSI